jgi:hypothetical protein
MSNIPHPHSVLKNYYMINNFNTLIMKINRYQVFLLE